MNKPGFARLPLTLAILGAVGISGCASTATSDATSYQAPRTEFGHPDLRGVWNFSSNTPLQRPEKYGDRQFLTREEVQQIHEEEVAQREATDGQTRPGSVGGYNQVWVESLAQGENLRTSLIVDPPDGRLPALTKDAVVHRGGLGPDSPGERPVRFRVGGVGKDGPEDRGLSERCLMGFNSGPPFMPSMYNNNVQIFQTAQHVVIMTEMIHDARIVPIDGRPHLPEEIQQWSGDSRGYWDGDTLVVKTRNFTDKTQSFGSAGIGSNLQLTEYFTRTADDQVEYKFTIDDPTTYTAPFTVLVPMVPVDGQLFEYACHEGNYGMVNILQGARKEEADAAAKNK
ncbi:hypothetical protein F6455_13925 [Proteobacteria bacterium 005FR1]|nr:hypothetical protein [Proteobacteria bacterium 005FR1]